MTRSTLVLLAIFVASFLGACANETANTATNKDTISQTTKPPAPAPGTAVDPPPRLKKQRPIENPSTAADAAEPQPAGEDSEFFVQMNGDGSISEFRTFSGHPRIVKAEVHWTAPTNKRLKLELSGGKKLEALVPEEFNLREVTSAGLIAAGQAARSDSKADRQRLVNGK